MKPRVLLSPLLAATLIIALTRCGDGDEPAAPEPPVSQSADADPSDEESADAEESASPSVTPAAGPLVDNDAVSFHLFKHPDWIHVIDRSLVDSWLLVLDEGNVQVSLTGSESPPTDLDRDAELVQEDMAIEDPPSTRKANRVLNGVECWVFAGEEDLHVGYHIGGSDGGFQYELSFEFSSASDWPEGRQRLEEMLASVELTFPTP